MARIFTTVLVLASITGSLIGSPLTAEQSLRRLHLDDTGRRFGTAPHTLVYTDVETPHPAYYVFENATAGGYIIASADDLAEPVLGYTEAGSFCYDSLPETMRWWLGEYAREIQWARNQLITDKKYIYSTPRPHREPIVSMVHSRWNQNAPFNDLCVLSNGQKAVTGCVATAMAQVLRYWKYPEKGSGSYSYSYNGSTHSFDFSATSFEWNEMPYILTNSWTDTQKNAVATLMRACGVSVDMMYTESSSGAYVSKMLPALVNYFGYSPSSLYRKRDNYGLYDWEDLVYSSLAHGCPVIYDGYGSGGHSFVVDGYRSNGYFHLNWGWGGASNGYFLLTALNPNNQGIGAGNGGYNTGQGATIDLRPFFPGAEEVPEMTSHAYTLTLDDSGKLSYSGSTYNSGLSSLKRLYLGFLLSADNGYRRFVRYPYYLENVPASYGRREFYAVMPNALPEGDYAITLAFALENPDINADAHIYSIQQPVSMHNRYRLKVDENGNLTLTEASDTEVNVVEFTVTTPLYSNDNYGIKVSLLNPGQIEIYKDIYVGWFDTAGSFLGVAPGTRYDIPAGELLTQELALAVPQRVYSTPTSSVIFGTGHQYQLALMTQTNTSTSNPVYERISDFRTVTLNPAQTTIKISSPNMTVINASHVYASDVQTLITLKGNTGYYANKIIAFLRDDKGTTLTHHYTPVIFLSPDETKTIDFSFPFDAGELNKRYEVLLNYITPQGNKYLNSTYFTIGTTGVTTPDADDEFSLRYTEYGILASAPDTITDAALFTMQGMRCATVDVQGNTATVGRDCLPHGIYLLRIRTNSASRTLRVKL